MSSEATKHDDAHGHDDHHGDDHGHGPKEVAWNMWLPVAILGALAVVGGFLNLPHSLGGSDLFSKWLEPLLYRAPEPAGHASNLEYGLMIFSGVMKLVASEKPPTPRTTRVR